jgi:hypothetical protein
VTSEGPGVLNQVFTVATGYGFISRCGCGWKAIHTTRDAAVQSGRRHILDKHKEGTR